jgi:hypothetical protein
MRIGDRRSQLAAAVTVVLLLVGGGLVVRGLTAPDAPPQPTSRPVASGPPTATASASSPTRPPTASSSADADSGFGLILAPSAPTALAIPSIGVRTKGIVELGLDPSGKLEAPRDFDRAGWYAAGPTPGEFGPSVIGAHVDSKAGPAVFYRLGSLKKGAQVSVTRQDGSTAQFTVDEVSRYAKNAFPTAKVYGDTHGRAELRLITCGGAFDRVTGHYVDNIVVFAHLTA